MNTEHDPPLYDGPFNPWIEQIARAQIAVHTERMEEHQRQLAFHENRLRYWERTLEVLQVAKSQSYSSLPGEEKERVEEQGGAEEAAAQAAEAQRLAEAAAKELADAEAAAAEAQAAADALAEQAARAEEQAALARQQEEARQAEEQAEAQAAEARRAEAARAAEAKAESVRLEAKPEPKPEPEPVLAVPAEKPVPTTPVQSPTGPPAGRRGPPSGDLKPDVAATVGGVSVKERMAKMGGFNPLVMMGPPGGAPLRKIKSEAEIGAAAGASPAPVAEAKPAEAEVKAPEAVASPPARSESRAVIDAKPADPTPPAQAKPIVKGPMPPPRKPNGGESVGGQRPAASSPPKEAPAPKEVPKEAATPAPAQPAQPAKEPAKDPAPPKTPSAPVPATPASTKKYCKANFDLDNPPKGCPKFKKGDHAELVENKGEWSHVIFLKNNEEGHVPTAYFTMDVPAPPVPTAKKMKAMYPFAPPKPKGFVPLKVGEIVTLEKGEVGEEWWVVKNAAGLSGYVPHNYVKAV